MPCVPALADGPSGGFWKGCRACLCLLGLPWLQANCVVVTVTWDPQPHPFVSEGVAPGGGRAQVTNLEKKGKTCGQASPSHCLALHWFRSRVGRPGMGPQFGRTAVFDGCVLGYGSLASLYRGGCRQESAANVLEVWMTFVLTWFLGVSRGDTWFILPDLVEVQDVGACVVRLLSHVVALVFRELLCLNGCMPRCLLPHVFDSAGSARVVFGLTQVVVEALLCRDLLSQEFIAGRSWWQFVAPCIANSVSWSECELPESVVAVAGCACCEHGCWFTRAAVGFVCALHVFDVVVRAKQMLVCCVAPLVEHCDNCLWLLLRCIAWLLCSGGVSQNCLCCLVGCRCVALAVEVHRLVALCSGDGFPEWVEGWEVCFISRALCALPDGSLVSAMGVRLAVPPVGVLALRGCSLFRVRRRHVVCLLPLLSVGCSGWWCFHMAFGAMSHAVATFVVKVALSVVRQALVVACVRFANVSECLALPTSDVFFGFASVRVPVEQVTIKKLSFGLAIVFLVGLVRVVPIELSTSACVLYAVVVHPFSFTRCSTLEGLSARQALVRCGLASPSHYLALRWFWSRVGRRESAAGMLELWTACPPLSCLWRWLVCSWVTVFLTLFPRMVSHCPSLHGGLLTPDRCFCNSFLGAVHGGTGRCSSLTSWSVRGAGWFCLWALDLVKLFLPDLVEVQDVGACVVRLWSHVVALVFHELLCLSGCMPRCLLPHVFDSAGSAGVVFGLT
ncbi:hypothetical protein Taro_035727 [Colocasia esculenta]|uniref:Uncharacterized protein n=1 Tax=Colocasia esculenta TaxID=4460 RepID=A0A843WE35_COLES|nr:hypothetical protein [Colocasia esculenta]